MNTIVDAKTGQTIGNEARTELDQTPVRTLRWKKNVRSGRHD